MHATAEMCGARLPRVRAVWGRDLGCVCEKRLIFLVLIFYLLAKLDKILHNYNSSALFIATLWLQALHLGLLLWCRAGKEMRLTFPLTLLS